MDKEKKPVWRENYEQAKEYMKALVKTRMFLKYTIVLVAVPVIFFTLLGYFLDWYTHHDSYIEVPNFKGLSADKVEKLADESKLRYKIVDSVFAFPEAPGGTVVEQSPPVKFRVKENRTIFLTIKRFSTEKIKMPNFVGISLNQAKTELLTYGFKLGKVKYEPGFKNLVLKQRFKGKEVKEGTIIDRGSVIDLSVGLSAEGAEDGDEQATTGEVTVPDLSGLSHHQAEMKLSSAALELGQAYYDPSVKTKKDTLAAQIFKQSPSANEQTAAGESIKVWLTVSKSKLQLLKLTK
jgi:eukaryotic-like serine/threonine-protein kinase